MTAPGKRALLFIESNTSGTGYLFASAAREMGYSPFLITAQPHRYLYLSQPDAPEVIVVSRVQEDEITDLIRRTFGGGAAVAGITSSSEYFIVTAAALAARFNLPGPDPQCVQAARDKSRQREAFTAGRLPNPQFRVARSVAEAVAASREIGFPVVIKPVDGTGSIGVRACVDPNDVERHATSLFTHPGDPGNRVLVESLITGEEFSVEVFSGRVVGITRKHLGAEPYFVEAGHDYPAQIPRGVARTLTETVTHATALLGLDWGPLHWELRIHRGHAYVMEVNPRLAGGFIPELVRQAEGIDLIRETLRLVVGEKPELKPDRRRYASIRFLFAPREGRLAQVEGIDEARSQDNVVDVTLYRSIGDELVIAGNFRDRLGHVIACAGRPEVARIAAVRARETVRIGVETVCNAGQCKDISSSAPRGIGVAR